MNDFVISQFTFGAKRGSALTALERPLLMNFMMLGQVKLGLERFTAHLSEETMVKTLCDYMDVALLIS